MSTLTQEIITTSPESFTDTAAETYEAFDAYVDRCELINDLWAEQSITTAEASQALRESYDEFSVFVAARARLRTNN